jgi:hypothetical protein
MDKEQRKRINNKFAKAESEALHIGSVRFLEMVVEYVKQTEVTIDYEFGKGRTDFNEIAKDDNLPEIYQMAINYINAL